METVGEVSSGLVSTNFGLRSKSQRIKNLVVFDPGYENVFAKSSGFFSKVILFV
ncbi:MAG: hypothetical protein WBW16_13410 [Bacteroidota bacterium]